MSVTNAAATQSLAAADSKAAGAPAAAAMTDRARLCAPSCVAALYVDPKGVYAGLDGVEVWDEARDARKYAGPWPVVAHPPCSTWGRFQTGSDGGCFAAALIAVRQFGGVIEHPEGSRAWRAFGLRLPDRRGGWVCADQYGGWTCCVEQGHYGHRARKATWLYAYGAYRPWLIWGPSVASIKPRPGRDLDRETRTGAVQRMCHRERAATPIAFCNLLLGMARSVESRAAA